MTSQSLRGDIVNIISLFFLYTLQGIPLGLSAAIPMILQNYGATYKQQAEFSFVQWPFSLKLLWAPIVDSFYWAKFGRRKSWLIPSQYLIGLTMIILAQYVNQYLVPNEIDGTISVGPLVAIFFFLNFLAATQDIAVDGWALTMLQKHNLGYASTCNSVGQTFGFFCGYVLFMALESKDFCNSYLRAIPQDYGYVNLSGFITFWGYMFLITTTLILFLKHEKPDTNGSQQKNVLSKTKNDSITKHIEEVKNAYLCLYSILKLPAIQKLALIVLTAKIGFAANDAITGLKLIEGGIPREKLALMAIPLIPVQVLLPILLAKRTNGPEPMAIYIKAFPYRLMFNFIAAFLILVTPHVVINGQIPLYFYLTIVIGYGVHQLFLFSMYVALMSFHAKISDIRVGGTYMTLLNTLSNLGGNWPCTLALSLVDFFTVKTCIVSDSINSFNNYCRTTDEHKVCESFGGSCSITFDGFHTLNIICTIIGFVWFQFWAKNAISRLQTLNEHNWAITQQKMFKKK